MAPSRGDRFRVDGVPFPYLIEGLACRPGRLGPRHTYVGTPPRSRPTAMDKSIPHQGRFFSKNYFFSVVRRIDCGSLGGTYKLS